MKWAKDSPSSLLKCVNWPKRSQVAAKEINEVAMSSVDKAEEAGQLINKIVPSIKNASILVQQINMNCLEQTEGAEQIRNAVGQLDQVTQQNSATSEECASASEELSSQAMSLQELVAQFKLKNSDGYRSMANQRELTQPTEIYAKALPPAGF